LIVGSTALEETDQRNISLNALEQLGPS